ncbi:N-acetyltransferase [Saccharopolyspora antimicrobica]|uniref:N-acetyltransferase n=1 Tax=Saccharopolyspora antimicrobica TaxID=455193 RepID=A0A1I4YDD8_9PSEU|nr:arylamine N-acetyltransferase [Saccharopolyspora antimicrobica]RKT82622.1 N-acetyltransferase [Saccharopolyspora antimicrobica]SFN35996.1 N-acetyltransferase [Saccharopolyspora antimicrobica]
MGKHAKDEWQTEKADLEGYLARIGHPAVPGPSVAALRSLHEAHVQAIPFENVDVVLGQHPGTELDTIYDKLVRRRRGGYCFEHALLFAAVLENLGFDVERRMARVEPDGSGYRTHMMLRVRVEGADHLADVGFGAGMLSPMPFEDGAVVDQAGWRHRLVRNGPLWNLEKAGADGGAARLRRAAAAVHRLRGSAPLRRHPPALAVRRQARGVPAGAGGEPRPGRRRAHRGASEQEFATLRKTSETAADSSLT